MPFRDYLSTADAESASALADCVATRNCVLFTGAGVSHQSGLPLAAGLVELIEDDLGLAVGTLDRSACAVACSRYETANGQGRHGLVQFLKKHLDASAKMPSAVHKAILSLDPAAIVTTNVDNLWEKALSEVGRPHLAIVRALHFMKWQEGLVQVIKLHGDLDEIDTLVFTREDYDAYPRFEALRAKMRAILLEYSLLFIGYGAEDSDFNGELAWLKKEVGFATRPHFLIVDRIEDWRRRRLHEIYDIRVIELGDYNKLIPFLQDLIKEVRQRRASARPGLPSGDGAQLPKLEPGLVSLFQSDYEPIRRQISEWRLAEAEAGLKALIERLDSVSRTSSPLNSDVIDFRQRLGIALANVLHWRSRRSEALQVWEGVQTLGPLSKDRTFQAAVFLANVGEHHALETILDDGELSLEQRAKLRAILAWQRGDGDAAMALVPETTRDLDLLLLRAKVLLRKRGRTDLEAAAQTLETAWSLAEQSPPGLVEVAQLSALLLQAIVNTGAEIETTTRAELVTTVRARFDAAIQAQEYLSTSYPEGLAVALASAMGLHAFLEERERVQALARRLRSLNLETPQKVLAEHLIAGQRADVQQVNDLFRRGLLGAVERDLILSDIHVEAGRFAEAEQVLRQALAPATGSDRLAVLERLISLLANRRALSEARDLLSNERDLPPDFVGVMESAILDQNQGREAAIVALTAALEDHPRSRILLERIVDQLATPDPEPVVPIEAVSP